MYWNSKIHSLVLISCHKNTSRICPLIVMFLMMPALLRQGKIFYKHLQQDFLKKNHFSKILANLITNVKVCIPKYEQYPSTNVLSTRINGRPIIYQPSKNIPKKEKKKRIFPYHGKSDFVALYVEHVKSDEIALYVCRSSVRSLNKLR